MNNRIIKPFDKSKHKCIDKGTSAVIDNNNNLYAMAFKLVYDKLPRWKQVAVDEGIKLKKVNDSVLDEFVANVILLAENNLIIEDINNKDNSDTEDNAGTEETCCGKE
jgi:hypothetical protein